MDNRIISIQSKGRKSFDLAFQIMFADTWNDKKDQVATHYFEHPDKGLIFLWSDDKFQIKLPDHGDFQTEVASKLLTPLGWKEAADLSWTWLLNQPENKYQDWIDHDGSMGKGFRIYNEDWGHVAKSHYAILGLVPVYAWYGK